MAPSANQPRRLPIALYLIAILFIVAPFGNLFLSFSAMGIAPSAQWEALWPLLHMIALQDYVRLGLTLVAGLALLRPRKASWAIALGAIAVSLVFSVRDLVQHHAANHFSHAYSALFLVSTLSVFVVLYYFRFPYLDRRDAWWGTAARYPVHFPVTIHRKSIDAQGCAGELVNLSRSGALVRVVATEASPQTWQSKELLTLDLADGTTLETCVERVDEETLGLSFRPGSSHARHWVHEQVGVAQRREKDFVV